MVIFVGQLLTDGSTVQLIATSSIIKGLYELYQDKKDDTELQIQILFTFLRVLSYQDTREELLYSTRCVSIATNAKQAAERKFACLPDFPTSFYFLNFTFETMLYQFLLLTCSLPPSQSPSLPSSLPPSLSPSLLPRSLTAQGRVGDNFLPGLAPPGGAGGGGRVSGHHRGVRPRRQRSPRATRHAGGWVGGWAGVWTPAQ